jgi:hypothetical protein
MIFNRGTFDTKFNYREHLQHVLVVDYFRSRYEALCETFFVLRVRNTLLEEAPFAVGTYN